MLKHRSTRFLSIAMTGTLLLGSFLPQGLAGRAYAEGSVTDHVVISQIYPGGGNANSAYKNDFIELYNPTDAPQDLAGWSVQYASATAAFSDSAVTPLSGTIAPHSYFLIQGAAGTSTNNAGGPLPVTPDVIPDATHTLNLAATNGKVALAKVATAIGGVADGNVVDFLGYGTANESYGTAAAAFGSSNSKSLLRKTNTGLDPYANTADGNGWDTKTNSADFVLGSGVLAPRSGQSSQPTPDDPAPVPTDEPVSIASIRQYDATNGSATNKGLAYTIEGVVTVEGNALGTTTPSFYVQDATGGINVFDKNNKLAGMTIHKGDKLRLAGTIDFYNGLTELIPTAVEYKGADTVPTPADVTIADFAAFTTAEPKEGTLVKLTGKVSNVASTPPNYNVTLVDESNKAVTVRVMAGTAIDVASKLVVGSSYTITGIVGQYDSSSPYTSGYQVFPRNEADLEEFHVLSLQHQPITSANINTDMPFTAVAEGADSVKLFYKGESDSDFTSIAMTSTDNANYSYTLPAEQVTFSSMQYYIVAEGGGKIQTSGSAVDPHAVTLETDVQGPVFSQESPLNGTRVENNRPEIAVKMDDPSGIDLASVQVLLDGQDVTAQATVQADGIKLAVGSDLALAPHQVEVSASDNKHNANSYQWSFTVVQPFQGGNHYRGTTHNHTNISHDGAGAPEEALIAAKAHQYDWFAFSDHSHDIDPDLVGQDTVDHNGKPERTGGSDWQLTKTLADQYSQNGEFVVFPAFEMTSTTWGHSNVFGTQNFIDRNINGKMYQDLNNYYAWVLSYDEIVAQFNHPDMSANAFNNFTPYDKNLDKLFTMLEVGNGSGNYSYANAEKKFYSALDLGWHVAPTFGEDNHDATWGQTKKRTVIVSQDLSQASLLDSMRNMRVYMEEDPNVTLDVSANGFYMGSTVPTKALNFSIKASDPVLEDHSMPEYSYLPADYKSDDRIAKVEIISNGGRVVDSYVPTSDTTSVDWTPNTINVTGGQQWFVVKITQKDGDQIYASPIWTPEADVDVKVSGLNVVGSALVAGVPVTMQAGISNLGKQALTNVGVRFYYDQVQESNLIGAVTLSDLAAKSVKTVSATWQSPLSGSHTLIAVVDAPPGDDPVDNLYSLPAQVKNPLGITVLMDANHRNENTTGDTSTYRDNMKTFTSMLQTEGYTVRENKAALDAAALNGVQVLMITHPSISLTAAEKTAVADFVKNGGSLLITEKSNFGTNDPTTNNDLLAQIGSTIQVNHDGIFDLSKTGNFWSNPATSPFAVRLHPSLVRNYITDRVKAIDFYSGSSLEGLNHTPLTNSDTVTILAGGNDTTYQDNIKNSGYVYHTSSTEPGGSVIPAIASEQVGNGRVIVSGMNVYNDKQLDQSFEPKGNVPFVLASINWLAHREPVVSKIADVRNLPDDATAVIEGTVTSAAGVFFDAFYVQDETGGIMAFNEVPEGSLVLGDKVRIYGHVKTFENNKEFEFDSFVNDVIKIGAGEPIAPRSITTGEALLDENQGQLVKVSGKVKSPFDDNSYVIDDGTGAVLVFTDGYIENQSGVQVPSLQVGDTYEAVGFTGMYANGKRIRVRDTREVREVPADTENGDDPGNGNDTGNGNSTNNDTGKVVTTKNDKGQTVLTVKYDAAALNDLIDRAATANGQKAVVVEIKGKGDQIQLIADAKPFARATITIKSELASLDLPSATVEKAFAKLGTSMDQAKLSVTITKSDDSTTRQAVQALQAKGATPLGTAIEYKIDVITPSGTQALNLPGAQIGHTFTIPAAANASANTVTGVIIDPATGDYYPVPTLFNTVNGELQGSVYHNGNATILMVSHTQSFSDTADNFAKPYIETLASKFVLTGTGEGRFDPDRSVTRAEFSTMLTRALGILPTAGAADQFKDINAHDWYANAVASAAATGMIHGYEDGSFRPNQTITRQEMIQMLYNALQLTGVQASPLSQQQQNQVLSGFNDSSSVEGWAKEAVAFAIQTGIMNGVEQDQLGVSQEATRAQSAKVLYGLLKNAHLIN